VTDLLAMIETFRARTSAEIGERRRARAEWRLREVLGRDFMQHLEQSVLAPGEFEQILDRIAARETDHYTAASSVMARAVGAGPAVAAPLDHVGIAVADAGAFVRMFGDLLGLSTDEPEVVGLHRLRFVDAGGATLELVEPTAPEAPVAKFLAKRGDALHHLCFRVADIIQAMDALKARGVKFIDDQPRQGAHGSQIAFLHPASAGGLLIELKQPAVARAEPGHP
jgi:methylmalonyl-CoA epimerase